MLIRKPIINYTKNLPNELFSWTASIVSAQRGAPPRYRIFVVSSFWLPWELPLSYRR